MTVKMESKRRLLISGVLIFGLLILTVHYPPVFLAVFAAVVFCNLWIFRIRCPKCRYPAWLREYKGKIHLKIWTFPPDDCPRCGWYFDQEYEDRRSQKKQSRR